MPTKSETVVLRLIETTARDSAAVVVSPSYRADASIDPPQTSIFSTSIEAIKSSTTLAEMRFPTTGNVEANFGRFCPADCPEGYGGVSLDARDRETLRDMTRVENLDHEGDGNLGEKSGCSF